MRKFFYIFIFIVMMSILYIYYMGMPSQGEIMQYSTDATISDTSTMQTVHSGAIQDIHSGAITPSVLVEMSGGVALDPYRHNSISGEERFYKGVPITPIIEFNIDCSTLDTEIDRKNCKQYKEAIERTKKERENTAQQSASTNTGTLSTGSSAAMSSF